MSIRYTPAQLAELLGQPTPTEEQAAVIGAPLRPGVIVAGAGSGKTETMSARVVWLVANQLVRPEQVLGLTFTRKAARELGARIRARLTKLAHLHLVDPAVVLGEATISTYDSYAGAIVAAHALRLGREPRARLISQAATWQYAQRTVDSYDGPMDDVAHAPATVVGQVLALHNELTGHLVSPAQLRRFTLALQTDVMAVPPARARGSLLYATVRDILARQAHRMALLPMVEDFRERKAADEAVDFADRAQLAAELAQHSPEIGATERDTYRVVLLDEYQDTSHAQLVLLRSLFGHGHPVTAVGDPCQSIYGWRGASAGTLSAFATQFRATDGEPAPRSTLATSFRNSEQILQVANRIAEPLRGAGVDVPELRAFDRGGPPGQVVASLHLTAADEAADIARRAREVWDRPGPRPTVAVLVRSRAQIAGIDAALRAVDLPVEIAELGGLVSTPEVADVIATLQVIADPSRGDALMRLLTGPRWKISPRDLQALGRARAQRGVRPATRRDDAAAGATGEDSVAAVVEPDPLDERSIVDVLDDLPGPGWLSPEAHRRLTLLGAELRRLRRRTGLALPDLVLEVERSIGVGVEMAARRGPGGRAHLDRFHDVAAEFVAAGGGSTLTPFLSYLEAAALAERGLERGDPDPDTADGPNEPAASGEIEVSSRAVQVLTVHGAKGLEWDVVFVPGLSSGVFPGAVRGASAWLKDPGALPYPLRGDAGELPHWDVRAAADQKALADSVADFRGEVEELALRDERRLAYVAVTRARSELICSGHHWTATRATACEPSPFLLDVAAACRAGAGEVALWVEDPGEENPQLADAEEIRWPMDPLGDRAASIRSGVEVVHAARQGAPALAAAVGVAPDDLLTDAGEWEEEITALLAERDRQREQLSVQVELPDRLSVSSLVALRADPDALARSLRRPVPHKPAPAARRGTRFHAWLEQRWGSPHLVDIDELPGSADADAVPEADIAELQEAFLASEWSERVPLEVEAPFELMLGSRVIRGRVDAVFRDPRGGLVVVDWKTGRPPGDAAEESVRAVQLAAYRLAFARLHELPLEEVAAAFHHVRENITLRPVDLLGEDELAAVIEAVPSS